MGSDEVAGKSDSFMKNSDGGILNTEEGENAEEPIEEGEELQDKLSPNSGPQG